MKKKKKKVWCGLGLLLATGALAAVLPPQTLATKVQILWSLPQSQLTTGMVFRVYSSTNIAIPMAAWPVITNTPPLTTLTSTNFAIIYPMNAEARYFVCTASNFWGESGFSAVASTPVAPRSDGVALAIVPLP